MLTTWMEVWRKYKYRQLAMEGVWQGHSASCRLGPKRQGCHEAVLKRLRLQWRTSPSIASNMPSMSHSQKHKASCYN